MFGRKSRKEKINPCDICQNNQSVQCSLLMLCAAMRAVPETLTPEALWMARPDASEEAAREFSAGLAVNQAGIENYIDEQITSCQNTPPELRSSRMMAATEIALNAWQ